MKARTSFLKRCLALVLALMMLVSSSNMGIALQAFAAGNSVSYGKLVAKNYDLTNAEKELLSSGNLAGGDYAYDNLGDGLVAVDTDTKTITAANSGDWVPTKAYIVVGEEVKETIDISSGECNYTYAGNAFSVKVDYTLDINVAKDDQNAMLNAMGWLKAGVANVDKLVAEGGALSTLELAMPELVDLADNGYTVFGTTVQISADVKTAIYALNDQINNGGHLNLVAMQEAYGGGKTSYLLNKGLSMKTELEATRENVNWIYTLLGDIKSMSGMVGEENIDQGSLNLINTLHAILGNWVTAADKAIAGDWTAAEKGTALVSGSVNYADLDAKVAALGSISSVTVKETLHVADDYVTVNLDMYDVTVKVVLKTTQDNEVKEYDTVTGKVTLAKGDTAEVIAAAAKDIINGALSSWGDAYVDGKFSHSESALPDALVEDITYTITYSPKEYILTLGYGDAMTVPYGYVYTLPKHADTEKSYDYYVDGEKMAQGKKYTVIGDVEITRNEGKAYTTKNLYELIADNYGNDVASAILKSGALKKNESISVRKPDPADSSSLIKLEGGKLVIIDNTYAADYNDLYWVPYTYGANGDENTFAPDPTEVTWSGDSVKAKYVLTLTNYSAAKVESIQNSIKELKAEADDQLATLNRLNAKYDQMGQLDKTKLGALSGVIGVQDALHPDSAKNEELKTLFNNLVQGIINNNLTGNNLTIYTMLSEYQAGGLLYYYKNSEKVIAEVDSLSGYLSGLLKADAQFTKDEKLHALTVLVGAAGYPEYVDKIAEIETILAEVKADLTAPNALINLKSDSLKTLTDALTASGDVSFNGSGSPYMVSENLTAIDNSSVMIQVFAEVDGKSEAFTSEAWKKNSHEVTQADVDALISKAEAYVKEQVGGEANFKCYTVSNKDQLKALVGEKLAKNENIYLTYTAKEYTISIEGEADQVITIKNPNITLPGHSKTGWTYTYSVYGEEKEVGNADVIYTISAENLVKGNYTITRTEVNKDKEESDDAAEDNKAVVVVKDGSGKVIAVNGNLSTSADSIEAFATELMDLGSYIELNDKVLFSDGTLYIQTLVDAILEDAGFGSQTLIDLGKNGGGKVFTGTMDYGTNASNMYEEGVPFTLNLDSVPGKMATVSDGLEKIKGYMTFDTDNGSGALHINLNLPEKIYEAYLTALLAAGEVDKNDINAIEEEIAMQFLYDYIELILATDATTTTYTNTLAKLGQSYDLTGAEDYYQMVKSALTNDGVTVNPTEDGVFDVAVTATGKTAINKLISLLGIELGDKASLLGVIAEYQDGGKLNVNATASLKNVPSKYEALVLDLNAAGAKNKFDYTNDLPERAKTIAGQAVVILLGDIDGNLKFPAATILDLNGFKVNGDVSSAGKLYIVDSRLETKSGAEVTGSVSANAVFGGKYSSLPASALKDGFVQTDGYVHNALYTIAASGSTYTFSVNTDVMEDVGSYTDFAKAVAVEVAVDLALNYFTAASLSIEGNDIYAANFEKILGMLEGDSTVDTAITQVLGSIKADGITAAANMILADLVDFEAISAALDAGETVATYALTTSPWAVTVEHITAGDYIDVGLNATDDASLAKNEKIAIKFVGDNVAPLADLTGEIAKVASALVTVKLEQPTYADKKVTVSGSTEATAIVDVSLDAANTDNYGIMVSVILAYGNPAKRAAVAEAANNNDMNALKAIFDETTVEEIFTALKKLSRDVNFKKMAEAVGVTADVSGAADLEAIYHLALCASGKALEKAGVTGRDSKMGGLYNEETGFYELTKENVFKDKEVSRKGYTVLAELTLTKLNLQLKLFTECMWGDVNHDDKVNTYDATLIVAEYLGNASEDIKCLLRADVNCDGKINTYDATLVVAYYLGNIDTLPYLEETT